MLIVLIVCLCPFPQGVYLKTLGAEIDAYTLADNGQIVAMENCTVKVNGRYYRSLLFNDFLNLSVCIDGDSGVHTFELEDISEPFSYLHEGKEYHVLYSAYLTQDANLRRVQMLWDSEWETLVLEIDSGAETHIIVAGENDGDTDSLLAEFCRLIRYTE